MVQHPSREDSIHRNAVYRGESFEVLIVVVIVAIEAYTIGIETDVEDVILLVASHCARIVI